MKMKSNKIVFFIFFIILVLSFIQCRKKYPENTMKLFQNPKGYDLMRGYITKFVVNEIDSLDLLANYQYTSSVMCTDPSVRNKIFQTTSSNAKNKVENDCIGTLEYYWDKKQNYLTITQTSDYNIFKKNLFLGSAIKWRVLKLVINKNNLHTLKMETVENGNTYQIQFN